MKSKSILISNFKFNPTTQPSDNLQVEEFYNVNFNHGAITSELSFQNIFNGLFTNEEVATLKTNNDDIFKKLVKIIPYEFYDDTINHTNKRLLTLDCNNKLHELDSENLIFEEVYTFSKKPGIIYHKNSLYFFDTNNSVVFNSNNIMQIESLPEILTFAEFESNLFFVDNTHLYNIYKAETDELKNLSCDLEQYEKYQINFENGTVYKIIKLKDKLIAITNSKILKFDEDKNMFVEQNDLKLNIYPNTIELIDDNIYFYTSNGFYKYDGIDTERLSNELCNILKNAKSVCFNQNYYIFSPNFNNFVYKYDFEKGYFSSIKFKTIEDVFVISNPSNYELCISGCGEDSFDIITLYSNNIDNTNSQFIKFKPTLFGSGKLKQINNIYFNYEGEFTLTIKTNLTQTSIIVNKQKYENLSIDGSIFQFEISSENYFKINSIFIEYYEVGE